MKKNFDKDKPLSYKVGDLDEVVDSRGNAVIMLRKLAWGDGKEKVEIRKWFLDINKERASKGVVLLTDDGPDKLAKALVANGYGNTEEIINSIKDRDDFDDALASIGKERPKGKPSDKFYDPKEACTFDE